MPKVTWKLPDGRLISADVPVGHNLMEAAMHEKKVRTRGRILDAATAALIRRGPREPSVGEVMGAAYTFAEAMLKSQLGAGSRLPEKGTVVITVKNNDKDRAVKIASDLVDLGYQVVAVYG